MQQARETLRVRLQAKLSYAEVDWGLAQSLSDAALEARLFRPAVPSSSHQLAPDFGHVHQELKRVGVTSMLLWEEALAPSCT